MQLLVYCRQKFIVHSEMSWLEAKKVAVVSLRSWLSLDVLYVILIFDHVAFRLSEIDSIGRLLCQHQVFRIY